MSWSALRAAYELPLDALDPSPDAVRPPTRERASRAVRIAVWRHLCWRQNKDTARCDPSIEDITAGTGLGSTAIKLARADLRDAGVLTWVPQGRAGGNRGGRESSSYTLFPPDPKDGERLLGPSDPPDPKDGIPDPKDGFDRPKGRRASTNQKELERTKSPRRAPAREGGDSYESNGNSSKGGQDSYESNGNSSKGGQDSYESNGNSSKGGQDSYESNGNSNGNCPDAGAAVIAAVHSELQTVVRENGATGGRITEPTRRAVVAVIAESPGRPHVALAKDFRVQQLGEPRIRWRSAIAGFRAYVADNSGFVDADAVPAVMSMGGEHA